MITKLVMTQTVIRTCGFYDCQYKFEGIKENGEKKTGKDKYREFAADGPEDVTKWEELIFRVYRPMKYIVDDDSD